MQLIITSMQSSCPHTFVLNAKLRRSRTPNDSANAASADTLFVYLLPRGVQRDLFCRRGWRPCKQCASTASSDPRCVVSSCWSLGARRTQSNMLVTCAQAAQPTKQAGRRSPAFLAHMCAQLVDGRTPDGAVQWQHTCQQRTLCACSCGCRLGALFLDFAASCNSGLLKQRARTRWLFVIDLLLLLIAALVPSLLRNMCALLSVNVCVVRGSVH